MSVGHGTRGTRSALQMAVPERDYGRLRSGFKTGVLAPQREADLIQ